MDCYDSVYCGGDCDACDLPISWVDDGEDDWSNQQNAADAQSAMVSDGSGATGKPMAVRRAADADR